MWGVVPRLAEAVVDRTNRTSAGKFFPIALPAASAAPEPQMIAMLLLSVDGLFVARR
jgi:hypothetical protein